MDLNDPTTATLAVAKAMKEAALSSAVYGGLALAAYGEPRETKDVDLAVCGITSDQCLDALGAASIEASITFERVRYGGNWVTRIALLGATGSTGLNVLDLVEPLSERFAKGALERALTGKLRGESITVLTPEDFILFKILSKRERDLEDAATVLKALEEEVDTGFIREEGDRLAEEISAHDVRGRLARILPD